MVKVAQSELRIKIEEMKSKMAFQSNSYTTCPQRLSLPPPTAYIFPLAFLNANRGRLKDRPWFIVSLSLSFSRSTDHCHSFTFFLFALLFFSRSIYDRSPQCPSVMTYG